MSAVATPEASKQAELRALVLARAPSEGVLWALGEARLAPFPEAGAVPKEEEGEPPKGWWRQWRRPEATMLWREAAHEKEAFLLDLDGPISHGVVIGGANGLAEGVRAQRVDTLQAVACGCEEAVVPESEPPKRALDLL